MAPPNSDLANPASLLLPTIVAGIILGAIEITFAVAFTAPVFSGELSTFLPRGFGIVLASAIVSLLVCAFLSSYGAVMASPQDIPTTLIAIMVGPVLLAHSQTGINEVTFYTVLALMVCSALLTGISMLGLGLAKLGKIIRLIPFPVIGGLLAGTGWLLVLMSVGMMTQTQLDIFDISGLPDWSFMQKLLPGLATAALLLIVQGRFSSPLAIPVCILLCIAVFHVALLLLGISMEEAKSAGYLIQIDAGQISLELPLSSVIARADWSLVIIQLPLMISLSIVCCIVALVHASSVEVLVDRELDMDRELRAMGIANMLVSFFGGIVTYYQLSGTTLAHRFKATTRLVGITAAAVCAIPFFVGSAWLGAFPVSILAAIVLYLGLDLLYDWLVKSYHRLPGWEYLIVIIIFLTIVLVNYPTAILLGIFCGMALFIIRYSHVRKEHVFLSGLECRSTVMRSEAAEVFLCKNQNGIGMIPITGFLFFGTSGSLFESVRSYTQSNKDKLKILILDFSNVPNIDSTATMGLSRIRRLAEKQGFNLVVSSTNPEIRDTAASVLFEDRTMASCKILDSVDQAVECAENLMLESLEKDLVIADSLNQAFHSVGLDSEEIEVLLSYCKHKKTDNGDQVIEAGSTDSSILLLKSGTLEVRQTRGAKSIRLRVYTPGMVVGEMTIYSGQPRTADVYANGGAEIYQLEEQRFELMEQKHPEIAIKLHRFLARNLAIKIMDEARLRHIRN